MATMEEMEADIAGIKERNRRVEADKAWEVSLVRRLIIAAGTYAFSVLLFMIIGAPSPYLAGLVPTLGFLLSTLTMPLFKGWWLREYDRA